MRLCISRNVQTVRASAPLRGRRQYLTLDETCRRVLPSVLARLGWGVSLTFRFLATIAVLLSAVAPALAHENEVILYGPFLGGFTHPVLGLDHFLAMLSVGIVSVIIGGRAIWGVPSTFVAFMALGGALGWIGVGLPGYVMEAAIAISVILLGTLVALDRSLPVLYVAAPVAFFGVMHGYAHGSEIPTIADPALYAAGFMLGTVAIHVAGVLAGDISRRYANGRLVLRAAGATFVVVGSLFLAGIL